MNTNTIALLRQYNKKSPYRKEPIDTQSTDVGNQIGTWSYANMYDALYDKFSTYKNFNINMWRDAIKLGEQDQYFAFLEQNKDNQLSNQFYDDQYYDYETMMLEMYLPFANTDNVDEVRTTEIFDPVKNEWVEQEIGKMSDRDYIQYQINNIRENKAAEIQKTIDISHKEELGWWGKFGHSALATLAEFGEGVLSGLTGIVDFFGGLGYASYQSIANGKNWFDSYVDYFGDKGLTALEKDTIRTALDEYERTHTFFRDIDGNMTGWGTYLGGVANSIGMMIPSIVTTLATAGTAAPAWIGSATFYTSIFSTSMHDTANNVYVKDSPSLLKIGNVAVKTAAEAIIEYGLGKVLGGTIQNNLLGIKGKNNFNLTGMTRWTGMKYIGKSAIHEGFEEFLQDFGTNLIDQFTDMIYEGYGNNGVTGQTLVDSFICGVLSSLFLSGGHIVGSAIKSGVINIRAKKDGTYNTEFGYGPGDVVIETEKGVQKLKGANKLYFSSILSDFRKAVNDLKNNKFSIKKNIGLAQEVYSGLNAISQFYSSFSEDRIKACEMLLDRVVKSEQNIHGNAKENVQKAGGNFAKIVEDTFIEMVGNIGARKHIIKKIREAIEKHDKELKDNKVTNVKGVAGPNIENEKINEILTPSAKTRLDELMEDKEYEQVFLTDGHIAIEEDKILFVPVSWLEHFETNSIYQFLKQSEILDVLLSDKDLSPLFKDVSKIYREFTGRNDATDTEAVMQFLFNESVYQKVLLSNGGKNAHEFNKYIFQMYDTIKRWADTSGYVKYRDGEAAKRVNALNLMLKRIKKAHRMPALKAILNWGFDLNEIKAWDILDKKDLELINQYEEHKRTLAQPLTGKMTSAYKNVESHLVEFGKFNDAELSIIEKAHDKNATIREKLLAVALLNAADEGLGGYDFEMTSSDIDGHLAENKISLEKYISAQDIGEKNTIAIELLYSAVQLLRGIGTDTDIAEDTKSLIYKFVEKVNEQFTKDFELYRIILTIRNAVRNLERTITQTSDTETGRKVKKIQFEMSRNKILQVFLEANADSESLGISVETENDIEDIMSEIDKSTEDSLIRLSTKLLSILKREISSIGESEFSKYYKSITTLLNTVRDVRYRQEVANTSAGIPAFTIPYQALTYNKSSKPFVGILRSDKSNVQIISDKLIEFEDRYGISAKHMISGNFVGMSLKQRNIMLKDMSVFGLSPDDYIQFVILKLENMLGNNFVVTPVYDPLGLNENANIQDIAIAEKIASDKLIYKEFFAEDIKTRNAIFAEIFMTEQESSDEKYNLSVVYKHIEKARQNKDNTNLAEELDLWEEILSTDTRSFEEAYFEDGVVLNPYTGEILYELDKPITSISQEAKILYDMLKEFRYDYLKEKKDVTVSDFIDFSVLNSYDISPEIQEKLKGIKVIFIDAEPGLQGSYSWINNIIKINRSASDCLETFIHEFNHAIQYHLNLPGGFNDELAYDMPDLLEYVANNYRPLFLYELRRRGYSRTQLKALEDANIILSNKLSTYERECLAFCAYNLVQGELYSRTYPHNIKVHGFLNFGHYILSPDGKTRFDIPTFTDEENYASHSIVPKPTPQMTESALYVTMRNVLEARALGIDNPYVTDTYHTRLTKNGNEIINSLVDKSKTRWLVRIPTIDELIREPSLLSEDVLDYANDSSEGAIVSAIKMYLEENIPGVSIDRTANTHRYVLVDDNAYDDLMLHSIREASYNNESTDLYEKYKNTEGVSLSVFYKSSELKRLGISNDVKVIINPGVKSEAVFERGAEQGTIYINADDKTTNAALIDKLNHEFRHILQRYNAFETGFTPDFKVTQEMIADVKKHVPELFKDQDLKKWAMLDGKNKNQSWETSIVQRFIYSLTGGELEAYGIHSSLITSKTIYVTYEAGKPTIFVPWYDATTGEGRYKTDFIAARGDDAPIPLTKSKGLTRKTVLKRAEKKEKDLRSRKFSKAKAEGTNLKYFVDYRNQLEPRLQDFIIATTGNEDKLPPALLNAIQQGALTRTAFDEWFRNADDINEFTFNLANKYIYKNDHINSIEQLDAFTEQMPYYYGLFKLIIDYGADLSTLLNEYDLEEFLEKVEGLKQIYVTTYKDSDGNTVTVNDTFANLAKLYGVKDLASFGIEGEGLYTDDDRRWTRVSTMEYFNGSPASAFKVADGLHQRIREKLRDDKRKTSSGDKTSKKRDDDKEQEEWEKIGEYDEYGDDDDEDNISTIVTDDKIGTDILALYEHDIAKKDAIDYIMHKKFLYEARNATKNAKIPDAAKSQYYKQLINIDKTKEELAALQDKEVLTDAEKRSIKNREHIITVYNKLMENITEYKKSLSTETFRVIQAKYEIIRDAEINGLRVNPRVFEISASEEISLKPELSTDSKIRLEIESKSQTRKNILDRIRRKAKRLITLVENKVIKFDDLPENIRNMFEYTTGREFTPIEEYLATHKVDITSLSKQQLNLFNDVLDKGYVALRDALEKQKHLSISDFPEDIQAAFQYVLERGITRPRKRVKLDLKQDVFAEWGRVKLPGETSDIRINYPAKRDITAKDDAYKHDTSKLLDIEELLAIELDRISLVEKTKKEAKIAADKAAKEKSAELRKRAREAEAEAKEAKKALKEAKKENRELSVKTDFVIRTSGKQKKKSGISDTENHFTVVSAVEMPEVLVDLLDVSFNRTAETLVQFASKDENGNLFYKERNEEGKLVPVKDFGSAMRHEVANWDIYYEAVCDKLQNMTRSDALNIIDFIEQGAIIFGPNANKLQAIQIYLVGYIIGCAEKNALNWNFSDAEKTHLRDVWKNIISGGGTILTSAKQMLEVIDPFEKVKQRMFDDWISVSDTDKDELKKAVENMQEETDIETRNKKAEAVLKTIEDWQKREFEMRQKKEYRPKRWSKEWFVHWWHKATSFRYLAMLSGPTTWIRNQVSNAMNLGLNTMADLTAKAVFVKKGYRKDLNQWDLSGVKISPEVKAFIDTEIKDNKLFKSLYNMSGKYDDRPGTNYKREDKQLQAQKELFISIITKRFEQKYAAEHRFDTKAMNAIAYAVNWLMSDAAFVKLASNRYFGKILTIEVERGNVSLDEGLSNNVLNLFAEAVIQANQEYMHKRSYISNMLDGLREKNAVAYEAITLFMPFMNSSWNWFTEILKYNPIALIGSIIKLNKLEQKVNAIEAIRNDPKKRYLVVDSRFTQYLLRRDVGKGVFGTLLIFLGLFLGLTQVLRFDEEDEKIYVYVGDAKVDISNIFGTSSVLVGAVVAQKWIEQSNGSTMSFEDRLTYVTEYLMQGFFINDMLERHSWNKTAWDKLLTETNSFLMSWNPQIIQLIIASTNNDKIRYSSGMKGMIERYLNSWIPTQPLGNRIVNPYTGEIESKYALPIINEALKKGVIFGAKVFWYDVDEVERLCRELGVNKNELTGDLTITRKDGSKEKYSLDRELLNKYYGKLNKDDLAKIKSQKHTVEMPDGKFKTLSWDKMSDEQRARVIDKTMKNNAEIAKIYIWTQEMGHKYYASNSLWSELRKLGVIKNVYKGDRDFVE